MIMERRSEIVYPSSDGKRMADNTLQYRWMTTIEANLQGLFADDANVFIAADLLWYPVEGFREIVVAPDVMVVLGRPKGDRKSYLQWEEDNIAPQVVFEILSDSNTPMEMLEKQDFYEEHGVEEYYVYDPKAKKIVGRRSDGGIFRYVRSMHGWVSPLLKIRFEMKDELEIYHPDGRRFLSAVEIQQDRERQRQRADDESKRADDEKRRADEAQEKMAALLETLRAQGINPDELPRS